MARPRKNAPPDAFTSTEVAVGAGLSQRNFGLLIDRGLAPEPSSPLGWQSANRTWNSFGIGHGALIGAFFRCGVELLLAARLADGFARETGASYAHLPSNLGAYLQRPLNPKPGHSPWELKPEESYLETVPFDDDLWLHHLLRTRSTIYRPNKYLLGDSIIEVADRQYVFLNQLSDYKVRYLSQSNPDGMEAEPTFRVIGWERGGDAKVVSLMDEIDLHHGDERFRVRIAELESEFIEARRNAIGLLRINISLAIRNAFDAIHDHRIASKTSIDWRASSKPESGRYAGCDLSGRPLDPEHPWNQNLSPADRAKRLLEIEEYIDRRDAERRDKEKDPDTS